MGGHLRDDAQSALAGGVYAAISFQGPEEILEAVDFAARMPGGRGDAAVAGARLGARHGVHALPVDLMSRLELAWVLDTLGHDLADQLQGALARSHRYPVDDSD